MTGRESEAIMAKPSDWPDDLPYDGEDYYIADWYNILEQPHIDMRAEQGRLICVWAELLKDVA